MPRLMLDRFYSFLSTPLFNRSRIVLALLVIPLAYAVTQPLWQIRMTAPQYPEGLTMDIYVHTIQGGHDGADINEINILNHYIGMKPLSRADLTDLDWIPFAVGFLVIYTLRCAAIGTVRSLVDVAVLTTYVGGFSFARFVFKLYTYGHSLNPDAPVKIQGFTPVIIGKKQVANFLTESHPATGTYLICVFAVGVIALLMWHLVAGRRKAVKEVKAAQPRVDPEAEAEAHAS